MNFMFAIAISTYTGKACSIHFDKKRFDCDEHFQLSSTISVRWPAGAARSGSSLLIKRLKGTGSPWISINESMRSFPYLK